MSSVVVQYDLFEKYDESVQLKADIIAIRESADRLRRRHFAFADEISKRLVRSEARVELLERRLLLMENLLKNENP